MPSRSLRERVSRTHSVEEKVDRFSIFSEIDIESLLFAPMLYKELVFTLKDAKAYAT